MIKNVVVFYVLFQGLNSFAVDSYNANTNTLTIPQVQVGQTTYRNVNITVGQVVSIGSSPSNGFIDNYNSLLNQLFIPSVIVGTTQYNNVTITVNQVLSVESFFNTIQNNSSTTSSAVISAM